MNYILHPGFGMMGGFGFFGMLVAAGFLLVIGIFLVTAARGIGEWNRNNHSPKVTVPAVVTAKRTHISRHHHSGVGGHHHHRTSTAYYVTFQLSSGDRMELHVSGQEYGLLAEGDRGNLSVQGTRYLGFVRI